MLAHTKYVIMHRSLGLSSCITWKPRDNFNSLIIDISNFIVINCSKALLWFLLAPPKNNIINIDLTYEQDTPFNMLGEKDGIDFPHTRVLE
jgi:hypothetical protein